MNKYLTTLSGGLLPMLVFTLSCGGDAKMAPAITLQPLPQTVTAGQGATFSVAASGKPNPAYQWERSGDGGTVWTALPGANASTSTILTTASDDGALFRVKATNSLGSITSSAALLTVQVVPAFIVEPVDQSVPAGQVATFSASAGGRPTPAYQWERSDADADWAPITGITTATFTFTPTVGDDGARFRVKAVNSVGSATSRAASLTVNLPPRFTTEPTSQTVTEGGSARFTAEAAGKPLPTYQWQRSADGTNWTPILDATSATYAFLPTAADDGARFRVLAANAAGSALSTTVSLAVDEIPTFTAEPTGQVVKAGETATFTAAVRARPAASCQWQRSADGSNWTSIPGATGATYAFTTQEADNCAFFRVQVANRAGSATSAAVQLLVATVPQERTIRGTSLLTYLPFDAKTSTLGREVRPNAALRVKALVPDGSGGFLERPGTCNPADGSFAVPQVPIGKYYLVYNDRTFIWTDESQVDLGWKVGGRPDVATATTSPTNLSFDLTGMNPWSKDDYLQWVDFNSGSFENSARFQSTFSVVIRPLPGETVLNRTIDWSGSYARRLCDTTKGDQPRLIQMATRLLDQDVLGVVAKEFVPSSLTMVNGTSTRLEGSLRDIPVPDPFTFHWNLAAFAQYRTAIHPLARTESSELYLRALPGARIHGVGTSMDLLYFRSNARETDLNLGTMAVPATPPGCEIYAFANYRTTKDYVQPGGGTVHVAASISTFTPDLPTATSPLRPLVSPILNPKIEGRPLAEDQADLPAAPTVAWDPPALGAPSGFIVNVSRIDPAGSGAPISTVGLIYTRDCSVRLPVGLLQRGKTYFIEIRAYQKAWDLTKAPFQQLGVASGYADFFSGTLTMGSASTADRGAATEPSRFFVGEPSIETVLGPAGPEHHLEPPQ